MHACMHVDPQASMHTRIRVCVHTHINTSTLQLMRLLQQSSQIAAYTYTHKHICMRTSPDTYLHTAAAALAAAVLTNSGRPWVDAMLSRSSTIPVCMYERFCMYIYIHTYIYACIYVCMYMYMCVYGRIWC